MTAVNTPAAAIRTVADGTATVGVVPMPEEDDQEPWWRYLMNEDAKTPRIVARLPFCGRGNARGDNHDALAVALIRMRARVTTVPCWASNCPRMSAADG